MSKVGFACPYCGTSNVASNSFLNFRKEAKCSGCRKTIDLRSLELVVCPGCNLSINVKKDLDSYVCPVCQTRIDVKRLVAQKMVTASNESHISVIRYGADPDVIAWASPIENFNMGSQLIVHDSQEAIVYMNGKDVGTFTSGTHTLDTENVPFLKTIAGLPDGKPMFTSKVYYINKTPFRGIEWGFSDIRYRDPNLAQMSFSIGINGILDFRVEDSRKVLVELVGQNPSLSTRDLFCPSATEIEKKFGDDPDLEELNRFVASSKKLLWKKIKPLVDANLADVIMKNHLDILVINTLLPQLSELFRPLLANEFTRIGLYLEDFSVSSVRLPEEDPDFVSYKKLLSQKLQAEIKKSSISIAEGVKQAEFMADQNEIARANRLSQLQTSGDIVLDSMKALSENATLRETGMTEIDLAHAKGMAEADVRVAEGMGQASIMREMGYAGKDILAADVEKARAEAMGQLGSRVGGASASVGGNGGNGNMNFGLIGDMAIGVKMAQVVGDQIDRLTSQPQNTPSADPNVWQCPSCGKMQSGRFCPDCGTAKPEQWVCPSCGKVQIGRFCPDCGTAKPEQWICPSCGSRQTSKFCSNCGTPRT